MTNRIAQVFAFAISCWLILVSGQWATWLAIVLATGLAVSSLLARGKLQLDKGPLVSLWVLWAWFAFRAQLLVAPEFDYQKPKLTEWQQELQALLRGVSSDAKALVAGLTYGDDSALSAELNSAMKNLSLTHLTAVSGANCAIVVAAVFWLLGLFGLNRTARVVGSTAVLAGYLALVGFQPSVIRAAAMAVVVLVALSLGKKYDPIQVLSLAIIVVLAIFSQLALEVGFTLSVFATFGLVWFAPKLYERLKTRLPSWLALIIAVPFSAQLFCLPILVTLQPEQSPLAIPANILVEPVVPVITLLGILAVTLSPFALLASGLFWLAAVFAQYIVAIAFWLDGLHLVGISFGFGWTSQFVAVLGVVWVVAFVARSRFRPVVFVLAAGGLAVMLGGQWLFAAQLRGFPVDNWTYVSCDVGQGDASVIRSQDHVAVIDVGRYPAKVDQCLRQLGVNSIELLVITHFDADHSAGLSGAIQDRKVKLALVTDFPDERPGAYYSETLLKQHGIRTLHAARGMVGKLGTFRWQVLSPHLGGEGSEDPNDGSITMLWHQMGLNILTLADLGERGQMRISEELNTWDTPSMHQDPLILKVSHHGSADQYPELTEWLKPTIATLSVGANNSYGHPTQRTLNLLKNNARLTLRTDLQGSLSVALKPNGELLWQTVKSG